VDAILKNLIAEECLEYMDEVVIYSKTALEHAQMLRNVLQKFDKSNFHRSQRSACSEDLKYSILDSCFPKVELQLRLKGEGCKIFQPSEVSRTFVRPFAWPPVIEGS
jgi:hypothetical protein